MSLSDKDFSSPKKPPHVDPSELVYPGLDSTLVNTVAQNRFIEAKVEPVGTPSIFSHRVALVGANRRRLLN